MNRMGQFGMARRVGRGAARHLRMDSERVATLVLREAMQPLHFFFFVWLGFFSFPEMPRTMSTHASPSTFPAVSSGGQIFQKAKQKKAKTLLSC